MCKVIAIANQKGTDVYLDPDRRTFDVTNGNIVILGSPGQGKSFLTKFLATNVIALGKRLYLFNTEEEWGYQNHVVFPLYFVDGVAEAHDEYFAPPEYGDYEYIEIRWSDDYIRVEYVID